MTDIRQHLHVGLLLLSVLLVLACNERVSPIISVTFIVGITSTAHRE